MEFTGERVIPDAESQVPLYEEHLARYYFAGEFVQNKSVLDLGCGTGYGSYYLSQQGAKFVLGTDIDAEAIQYAQANFKSSCLAFFQSDVSHLPLNSQIFDVVVSFEVIEHLKSPTPSLAETSRVMTDKGWLVGSTPNRILHSPGMAKPHNTFHCREYDPAELERQLRTFFAHVVVLGQRPFHGFVVGPVASAPAESERVVQFLPEDIPLECSVADSKDLIFVAGKRDAQIAAIQKHLHSHYYLGRPASRCVMQAITDVRGLQSDYDRLQALVKSYESGKFIRFMSAVHRWRS